MQVFKINSIRKSGLVLSILTSLFFISCHSGKQKDNSNTAVVTSATDTSWALLPFKKADSVNPVLQPTGQTFYDPIRKMNVAWEAKDVFNPAVVIKDNKIYMLYRAQDSIGKPDGTSRIGRQ